MQITITADTDTDTGTARAMLVVVGRFDAHECPAFRAALDPLLAGGRDIDLDLSAVGFVDSSALAELVRARKRARSAGGDTRVVRVSDPVRVILELTGLTEALTTGLVRVEGS